MQLPTLLNARGIAYLKCWSKNRNSFSWKNVPQMRIQISLYFKTGFYNFSEILILSFIAFIYSFICIPSIPFNTSANRTAPRFTLSSKKIFNRLDTYTEWFIKPGIMWLFNIYYNISLWVSHKHKKVIVYVKLCYPILLRHH